MTDPTTTASPSDADEDGHHSRQCACAYVEMLHRTAPPRRSQAGPPGEIARRSATRWLGGVALFVVVPIAVVLTCAVVAFGTIASATTDDTVLAGSLASAQRPCDAQPDARSAACHLEQEISLTLLAGGAYGVEVRVSGSRAIHSAQPTGRQPSSVMSVGPDGSPLRIDVDSVVAIVYTSSPSPLREQTVVRTITAITGADPEDVHVLVR